jgi:hypothetical protein
MTRAATNNPKRIQRQRGSSLAGRKNNQLLSRCVVRKYLQSKLPIGTPDLYQALKNKNNSNPPMARLTVRLAIRTADHSSSNPSGSTVHETARRSRLDSDAYSWHREATLTQPSKADGPGS